ncbi:hypothetical protein ['Paenibacillus yunnanensis' Narsing Rao et al. 2020]|nr:hypothetical protein [Paenibacillus tengchongensis]
MIVGCLIAALIIAASLGRAEDLAGLAERSSCEEERVRSKVPVERE